MTYATIQKYAPFDLEKAKAGAPILCRINNTYEPARLIAYDLSGEEPLAVALQNRGKTAVTEYVACFAENGECGVSSLFMAPVKHTGWIVIAPPISDSDYVAYSSNVYCTEQKALDHCDPRTEVVIQIKWEA